MDRVVLAFVLFGFLASTLADVTLNGWTFDTSGENLRLKNAGGTIDVTITLMHVYEVTESAQIGEAGPQSADILRQTTGPVEFGTGGVAELRQWIQQLDHPFSFQFHWNVTNTDQQAQAAIQGGANLGDRAVTLTVGDSSHSNTAVIAPGALKWDIDLVWPEPPAEAGSQIVAEFQVDYKVHFDFTEGAPRISVDTKKNSHNETIGYRVNVNRAFVEITIPGGILSYDADGNIVDIKNPDIIEGGSSRRRQSDSGTKIIYAVFPYAHSVTVDPVVLGNGAASLTSWLSLLF